MQIQTTLDPKHCAPCRRVNVQLREAILTLYPRQSFPDSETHRAVTPMALANVFANYRLLSISCWLVGPALVSKTNKPRGLVIGTYVTVCRVRENLLADFNRIGSAARHRKS